jgi:hypothetical protein
MHACGSPQSCCGAGGGQATSVEGELPQRKKAVGKCALTDSVVVDMGLGRWET